MSSKNQIAVWDFTVAEDKVDRDAILKYLKENAKRWVFQLETSDSGYTHYQGRLSLKEKVYKMIGRINKAVHWSPTSSDGVKKNKFSYVMKEETRIQGPWTDKDEEEEKKKWQPKALMGKIPYPWQQKVLDSIKDEDDRKVNVVVDKEGNSGKSMLKKMVKFWHSGYTVPPVNDAKDLAQAVCCMLEASGSRDPGIFIIDLPRAMNKDKLFGMYSAIEQIKDGVVYDLRYKYKEFWFNSPQVWVFTNHMPECDMLSKDRWSLWKIVDKDLAYTPLPEKQGKGFFFGASL